MSLSRREFLQMLSAASACGMGFSKSAFSDSSDNLYEIPTFGDVRLLHFTDCHAQLMPIYFREPSINIGVGEANGKPPHLVGENLLNHFGITKESRLAHAFTYMDFVEAAQKFGKVGGFAHLATLIKKLRDERPDRTLLLDGGDTWQGSATALWTKGQDMVGACKLLGVDIMTGHWEFTYGKERVMEIIENELPGHIEFLAQNAFDISFGDEPLFKPYTMRELGGVPIAIIGQAFPYTPIANPGYLIEEWSFGIRDERMQEMVDTARGEGAQVVVLLSHNGMDVDLKMASRVTGIDAILGGHTHDGVPAPVIVENPGGKTLVTNAGSNGKYLSVLDLEVKNGAVADYRFKLLPVFSNLLAADAEMQNYIDSVRAPYEEKLAQSLAVTDATLYRRGNFIGTFDQLIVDALLEAQDAEIAFSPGFRWGTSLLPGDHITVEHVMDQTAITYGKVTLNEMSGEQIKLILEDIADNLFNTDPYLQMGGDMVRVGGLKYAIAPNESIGNRISSLDLNSKPLDPGKTYKVAGWASVNPQPDELPDIWDVVSKYLESKKTITNVTPNIPKIVGVDNNPGLAMNNA